MHFKLTSPCDNCPFRSDIVFYLAADRRKEIADALRNDKTFSCHKTTNNDGFEYDDEQGGVEYHPSGKEQHCAGALIAMAKEGELWRNFLFRLAKGIGMFDDAKLNLKAPVLSLDQFILGSGTEE